jgi:putative transposase
MVTPAAKREAVAHLQSAFEMSERRACKVIDCCRMTVRYAATRTDDGILRERMKAMAHERRRFGYRRLHVLLRREGDVVNHKRLPRGTARCPASRRPQAGDRHASADDDPVRPQRPLVAGLCLRPTHRWPPLPHPDGRRRLQPHVPWPGG